MDQLTVLRRARADVPDADPAALAAARARLLERAARPSQRRSRPARALMVAAAAAIPLALVAGIGLWPGSTPPATAAALLHRAADATGDVPLAGPGQYLVVETHENALGYVQDDQGDVLGAYLTRTVSISYIPHDPGTEWLVRTWSLAPTTIYGGAAVEEAAADDYAESAHVDSPLEERALAGQFGNGELGGDGSDGSVAADRLTVMPRDPEELLDHLVSAPGVGTSRAEKVISQVGTLLRSGLVPRDLRSSMYDALALLPGVRITEDQTSLDGRTGTAIGVREGNSVYSVVIDTDTGAYLGQLQVLVEPEGPVPAGTVMDQTSLRVFVVDDVP